jgi:hypothetical protein
MTHPSFDELLGGQARDHVTGCSECALMLALLQELALGDVTSLKVPESREQCLSPETVTAMEGGRLKPAERAAARAHLAQCRDCFDVLHDSLALAREMEAESIQSVLAGVKAAPPKDTAGWRTLLDSALLGEGTAAVRELWDELVHLPSDLRESWFGLLPLVRWWGGPRALMTASGAGRRPPPPSCRIERLPIPVSSSLVYGHLDVRWVTPADAEIVLDVEVLPPGTHVSVRGIAALDRDGVSLEQPCTFELDGTGDECSAVQAWPSLPQTFPPEVVGDLRLSWSFRSVAVTPPAGQT